MAENAKYSSYVNTISNVAAQGWSVPELDLFQARAKSVRSVKSVNKTRPSPRRKKRSKDGKI